MIVKNIVQATSWLSLSHIFTIIIGFLSSLIFANFFTQQVFGEYQYLNTIIGTLGVFSLSGIPIVLRLEKSKVRSNLFSIGYYLTGGISLVILFVSNFLFNLPLIVTLIIALGFFLTHTTQLTKSYLHSKKLFRKETSLSITITLIAFLGLLISAWKFSSSAELVFSFQTILPLLLISFFGATFINSKIDVAKVIEPLKYGLWLSLVNLLPLLAENLDSLLIGSFISFEDLAIYTYALSIPLLLQSLLKNIALSTYSFVTKKTNKNQVYKILQVSFFISIIVILLYQFFSGIIFRLLFPRYIDSLYLSRIGSLILLGIPGQICMSYFQIIKRKKLFLRLTLILSSFSLIITYFGFLLGSTSGLIGAKVTSKTIASVISISTLVVISKQSQTNRQ